MTVRINSNIASLIGQRRLAESSAGLSRTLERLSSGSRINRASDDAAGLSVAESLRSKARIYSQGVRNLNDGISALSIADQSLQSLSKIVERQRELALQSANGVFSLVQRQALDTEAQALSAEYQRILDTTRFNGQYLLNRSRAGVQLQAGFGDQGSVHAEILGITDEEITIITQNLLSQNVSSFGSLPTVAHIEFYTHDFNQDGTQDLFFVGRAPTGTATLNYAMGILLGSETGTYALSGPVREGTLDPPTGGSVVSFSVEVSTSTNTILVTGETSLALHFAEQEWDYSGAGVIETTPTTTTGSFGDGSFGNTTDSPTVDLNDDGRDEEITLSLGAGGSFTIETLVDTEGTITAGSVSSLQQSAFSIASSAEALAALESLSNLATRLNRTLSQIGASQSRVEASLSVLTSTTENFIAAESRIRDADVAAESANLIRFGILQQAGAAIVGQANILPELALTLLEVRS